MIKIKTPATSANLSVGFDTIGIAFNKYNIFSFKENDKYIVKGFRKAFSVDSNLVLESYLKFSKNNLTEENIKKVEITLEENNIPVSRGLGSSASCILAGVFAANEINKLNKTFRECVDFASDLEGHGDNIYACAYGFLNASLKDNGNYIHKLYEVSENLNFHLLIPSQEGQTKQLRNILPKKLDYSDAVFNLSRVIFVPDAFKNGDFKLLKIILKDQLHEKYRYPFIPMHEEIKKLSNRDDLIVCISGSGPSVLIISEKTNIDIPKQLQEIYKLVKVNVSKGTQIEVIE